VVWSPDYAHNQIHLRECSPPLTRAASHHRYRRIQPPILLRFPKAKKWALNLGGPVPCLTLAQQPATSSGVTGKWSGGPGGESWSSTTATWSFRAVALQHQCPCGSSRRDEVQTALLITALLECHNLDGELVPGVRSHRDHPPKLWQTPIKQANGPCPIGGGFGQGVSRLVPSNR